MAKEETKGNGIITPEIKEGPIDLTVGVVVVCTDKAPHHNKGEETLVAPAVADKMVANGWGKIK